MTPDEAILILKRDNPNNIAIRTGFEDLYDKRNEAFSMAIKALEQEPIDKFAMMHEIYMEGVNMSGEYQGCWVRFKDIEKIVDKYIAGSEA